MINLSNHPSSRWGEKQRAEALKWGGDEIVDIPFPQIPPDMTAEALTVLVREYVAKIVATGDTAVHVMGEMGFTFGVVHLLMTETDIFALHSTTERRSVEGPDGTKTSVFEFVQFREYWT